MRFKYFILILMLSVNSYGQKVYTSPLTQHFPGMELETISRVIKIDRETITINTKTPRGEDVQILKIVEKLRREIEGIGTCDSYLCSSFGGEFITHIFIPIGSDPEFIDAIEPAQLQQPERYLRLLLDTPGQNLIFQ